MSSSLKIWNKTGISSLILAGFIVAYTAPPAQAGFNWTPPANNGKVLAKPNTFAPSNPSNAGPLTPEPDAPTAPLVAAPLAPVAETPFTDMNMHSLPAKEEPIAAPSMPQDIVTEKPLVLDTTQPAPPEAEAIQPTPLMSATPAAPTPIITTNIATNDNAADVIQGFGKDIPLVIALRDIVPAGYAYAFTDKAIAGTKISWQGGKSWGTVLSDALSSKGIVFSTTGHVIQMSYAGTTSATTVKPSPVIEPAPVTAQPDVTPPANDKPLDLTQGENTATKAPPTPAATSDIPNTYSAKDMVMDMSSRSKWQARPGSTLHQVLNIWCKQVKVDLQWLSPYDFPINNAFTHEGTFNEALTSLLSTYSSENPRPRGRLYPNAPDGPSVLMIN